MSGVKVELQRLKKRVARRSSRSLPAQIEAHRMAFLDRLARSLAGKDVSGVVVPSIPDLPPAIYHGARERLCARMLAIVERQERAAARRIKVEHEEERGHVSAFVAERMKELAEETRGEPSPASRLADEEGNPLLSRLRQRRKQFEGEDEQDD
jgi:hypothetical protein